MKLLAIASTLGAVITIASGAVPLHQKETDALSQIDTVPTRQQLDDAFLATSQDPLTTLSSLAIDTDPLNPVDVGVRIRAIHALAKYCQSPCASTDVAHTSLVTVIGDNHSATSGSQLLLLRAAIETLGTMRVTGDDTTLGGLLSHPSRDIRAATARALGDLCSNGTYASNALRTRYTQEGTEQVKLAISEALRVLEQCAVN